MGKCISLKRIISLFLAITLVVLSPLNHTAKAADKEEYLSEVYVAYGKNAEAAKKVLEAKGFTPVEGNLNEGGKTYSMMGYKTTDDIRDAITDLAVMNMSGGYSVEDYKYFLKSKKEQIAEFLNEFIAVIREYRANYKAGKTKAKVVHDLLNNYIEDDTGMKMGDLFNSQTLQDKVGVKPSIEADNPDNLPDLVTILMQGNVQVIKSMEVLLSMAADSGDNTWIDRFAELDYDSLLDRLEDGRPDLNTENKRKQYLENVYGDAAGVLGMAAEKFRDRLIDYENMSLQVTDVTEEKLEETFGDPDNDYTAVLNTQQWLAIGSIYEGLKNYEGGNYAKGELLEFFLDENDPEDEEIFIPMAAALSEGQRCGMPFISFENLLEYAFATDESWKKIAGTETVKAGDVEDISVYAAIDRSIYADDGTVALTDKAKRADAVGTVGTDGNAEAQRDALNIITKISWAVTAMAVAISAVAITNAYDKVWTFAYDMKEGQWLNYNWNQIFKPDKDRLEYMKFSDDEELLSDFQHITEAHYALYIAKIVVITTIVIAVISAVLTIIDLLRDKSAEQLPIPKYMVDSYSTSDGGTYELNYKAVECNREEYFGADYKVQKGSCADLLADEGEQWLALYASKNSKAGSGKPLTTDIVIQESKNAPSGYEGNIHLFGEKGAVNTVGNAFKMYSAVSNVWQTFTGEYTAYVFCKLSDKVKTYDESAGNMTASSFRGGMAAIWGFGGIALGAVLGILGVMFVRNNKKKKEIA